MKKTIAFCIVISFLITSMTLSASASDSGFKYEIVDNTVTITGYNGISRAIVIPDTIEDTPVTKIAPYAFDRSGVTSVKLPDTIEEIGEKAFFRCYDLVNINMPQSLKSIGHNAFAYTGLTEVNLGGCSKLENIGAYAFAYCDSLKTFTFPEKVPNCGYGVIMQCPALKTVNNPDSYTSLQHKYSGDISLGKSEKVYTALHKLNYIPKNDYDYASVEEIHIDDPTDIIIDGTKLNDFKSLRTVTIGEHITEPESGAMTYEEFMEYVMSLPIEERDGLSYYEYYDIDTERGIIYNKTQFDKTGRYYIQYVIPEWEGAEILVLPDHISVAEGAFNHCKRKAVVFQEKYSSTTGLEKSDTGNTVFFYSKENKVKGVRTASLEKYTPENYPYADFESESPISFPAAEKIADNSKYTKTALAVDMPFTDVSPTAWYFAATNYAYNNDITSGTGEGLFSPDVPLTRAMFVQMLAKIEKADLGSYKNKNTFTDVPSGEWYHNAVEWAYEKGIVSGMGNGIFAPNDNITREQMAVIMCAMSDNKEGADISKYTDKDSISSWALDAIKWAVKVGYISGTSETTLSPGSNATRAQALQILYRYIDNIKIDYADGEIKVSKAFSDDMIIQRGQKINVWGEAEDNDKGKYIKVDLGGKAFGYAVIDENGQWKAELDRILPASDEKIKLTVSTKNQKIEYDGIMMGDVYMIIGQSNVYYGFNHLLDLSDHYFTTEFAEYLRKTRYMDNVRLFRSSSEDYKYYSVDDTKVYTDVIHDRGWEKPDDPARDYDDGNGYSSMFYDYTATGAEPMACEVFSAYGYIIACELYERTGIPTGMIEADGCGYSIGAFLPNELCEQWNTDENTGGQYIDDATGMKSRFVFNQCINPLMNFSISGLIWYQGESDILNTTWTYDPDTPSFAYRWSGLMDYLREHMATGDFPVYLTEFPMYSNIVGMETFDLGAVRGDESRAVNLTENAYLIPASDTWTDKTYSDPIHAPAKSKLAKRLADMLTKTVYGADKDPSEVYGPIIKDVEFGEGEIILTFDNVGEGLKFYGGAYTGGFSLLSNRFMNIYPISGGSMKMVDYRSRTDITDPGAVEIIAKDKVRIKCDHADKAGIAYNVVAAGCFPYNCNLCNSYNIPAGAFSSYK